MANQKTSNKAAKPRKPGREACFKIYSCICVQRSIHSLYLLIHLILALTTLHTFRGDTCSSVHNFNDIKHERHVDLCRNIFSQTNATQSLQSVLHLTSVQWQYYSPAENTHDATGKQKKNKTDNVQKMTAYDSIF